MNVILSQKGWVVIPAKLRKKYQLKSGANLLVIDYGGVLALVPAFKNPVEDGAGLIKGQDSLTVAIKREHLQELKNESQ